MSRAAILAGFLYVIRDRVANMKMGNPIIVENDRVAARLFMDIVADKDSVLSKHPTDYEIVRVADVDRNGLILEKYEPILIADGAGPVVEA